MVCLLDKLTVSLLAGRARRSRTPFFVGAIVLLCSSLAERTALAGPLDPILGRLVVGSNCATEGTAQDCVPDQNAFYKLVSQWGAALIPSGGGAARSVGSKGLELAAGVTSTTIASSANYWVRGARGERTRGLSSLIEKYFMSVTKGYGYGLETTGSLGIVPGTEVIVWGLDVREAPFEGLQTATSPYLPDVSLGAGVRQVTGFGELSLSTLAVDARASYRFLVGSQIWISPWGGAQWARVAGRTALIDFTPGVDAVSQCGYVGQFPTDEAAGLSSGDAECPGSSRDAANTARFESSVVYRYRALAGLELKREWMKVGLAVATDLVSPGEAQTRSKIAQALGCQNTESECDTAPRQWSLSVDFGVAF